MDVAPSASLYGVGPAWIGGRLFYSDGVDWQLSRNTPISPNAEVSPRIVNNMFAQTMRYPTGSVFGTGVQTPGTYTIGSEGVTGGTLVLDSGLAGRAYHTSTLPTLEVGKYYCISFSITAISGTLSQDVFTFFSGGPSVGETNLTAAKVNAGGTGRYCVRFQAASAAPVIRLGVGTSSNVASQVLTVRDFMIEQVSGITAAPSEYEYPQYSAAYNYNSASTVDTNQKVTAAQGTIYKLKPYSCILSIGDSRNDEVTNIGAQLGILMRADGSGVCQWHADSGWKTTDLIGPTTKKTLSLTLAKAVAGTLLTRTFSTDGNEEMYETASGTRYQFDTLAIVDFGVNDVVAGTSVQGIMANMDTIVRAAVGAGMRIVISENNPFAANASYTAARGLAIVQLNSMLRNYAITNGHLYVPTWDAFGLPNDQMTLADGTNGSTNYSVDGLHLNTAGSVIYAQMLKDAIDQDRNRMS